MHQLDVPVCCTSRGKTERRRDLTLVITQDSASVTGQWSEASITAGQGTLAGTFAGTVNGILGLTRVP